MPMTRTGTPEVIAIAGAGDLGRYVCEEILKSTSFVPVILSRGVRSPTPLRAIALVSSQLIPDVFNAAETNRSIRLDTRQVV